MIVPVLGLLLALMIGAAASGLVIGRAAERGSRAVVRLGRVARRVLRRLPCPVVVVPPDLSAVADGPILLATDLDVASASAVTFARDLAARHGRELKVVHVGETRYSDLIDDLEPYWQQARDQLSPGEKDAQGLDNAIAKAREQLGQKAAPAAQANAATGKPSGSATNQNTGLSGRVALAPNLKGRVSPEDTVFIYATPANGERVPLAIIHTTVSKLPMTFTLDDSTAMNPQRKLSGEAQVTLKARVSKSGNALSQTGDLMGTLTPVKVGSRDLSIVINDELK